MPFVITNQTLGHEKVNAKNNHLHALVLFKQNVIKVEITKL